MTSPIQESNVQTQYYFFECLSDDFLNTLLHRVSSGILVKDILIAMILCWRDVWLKVMDAIISRQTPSVCVNSM